GAGGVALIGEPMNRLHAFAQSLQQRFSPTKGCKRRALLVCLLIGLSEKPHVILVSLYVFFHGYHEFDFAVRLPFLYGEEMKLGEFIRRLRLRKGPIRHSQVLSKVAGIAGILPARLRIVTLGVLQAGCLRSQAVLHGWRSPAAGTNSRS